MPAPSASDVDRAAYAQLVAQSAASRARYDALLLKEDADEEELAAAEQEADEADRARQRTARLLRNQTRKGARASHPTAGAPAPSLDTRSASSHGSNPPDMLLPGPTRLGAERRRDQVADVLSLFGVPARTQQLAAGVRELDEQPLTSAQLVTLRREEQRQHQRASTDGYAVTRPWYITPCLSGDSLIAAPGTFSLSTWPLADRIITPHAPRLWTAQTVVNLVAAYHRADNTQADGLVRLLRNLLRGTSWGRSSGWHPVESAGNPELLDAAAADAQSEVRELRRQHKEAAAEAVERIEALQTREQVSMWGLARHAVVRTGTGGRP